MWSSAPLLAAVWVWTAVRNRNVFSRGRRMPYPTEHPVLGTYLPPVASRFTADMFKGGDIKTIHNDQAAAAREGLSAPIAVGPQVAALIFRMMRGALREGWIRGGRSS